MTIEQKIAAAFDVFRINLLTGYAPEIAARMVSDRFARPIEDGCTGIDDNPSIEPPMKYGHGAVFERDDGRMAILLAVCARSPYVVLESNGETTLLVSPWPTPPDLLTVREIVGREVLRWRHTTKPFRMDVHPIYNEPREACTTA